MTSIVCNRNTTAYMVDTRSGNPSVMPLTGGFLASCSAEPE